MTGHRLAETVWSLFRSRPAEASIEAPVSNDRWSTFATAVARIEHAEPTVAGNIANTMTMQAHGSRGARGLATFNNRASARIRRAHRRSMPLCSTNGCATYLDLDRQAGWAICPVCGYRRPTH